jgi:hypothetical protein
MPPSTYFRQKLTQPLPIKGGPKAANYILALPHERAEYCNRWRHAAKLLLDQADVAEVRVGRSIWRCSMMRSSISEP